MSHLEEVPGIQRYAMHAPFPSLVLEGGRLCGHQTCGLCAWHLVGLDECVQVGWVTLRNAKPLKTWRNACLLITSRG